jgi:hypothetical protein
MAYSGVLSIAVPATINTYTDTFGGQPGPGSQANNGGGTGERIIGITVVLLGTVPNAVAIELWYLMPVPLTDPANIANYAFGQAVLTAAGGLIIPQTSWPGLLIRAKSGGTAGTATIWYAADTN